MQSTLFSREKSFETTTVNAINSECYFTVSVAAESVDKKDESAEKEAGHAELPKIDTVEPVEHHDLGLYYTQF